VLPSGGRTPPTHPKAGKVLVNRCRLCHEIGLILSLRLQIELRRCATGQASLDFHIERYEGYYAHVPHTMLINILHGHCKPIKREKAHAHNGSDGDEEGPQSKAFW
jgi:hypothetical protein